MADLAPRIKLLLSVTDMKTTIEEIDDSTAALERFTRLVLSNRQTVQNSASRSAVKLAKALRHIRAFASSLYTAILDGFQQQGRNCHTEHEARLYLEDRIDLAPALLRQIGDVSSAEAPLMYFDVVFTASNAHGERIFYETPVQVFGDTDGKESFSLTMNMNRLRLNETQDSHRRSSSRSSAPEPNSHLTLIVSSPRSRSPSPHQFSRDMVMSVASICTELTQAKDGKRRVSFALVSKSNGESENPCDRRRSHIGTINDNLNPVRELSGVATVSLRELLAGDSKPAAPLSWRFRMRLAVRIASSVLQLMHTQWLSHAWSKDLVLFLVTSPTASSKVLKVDLDRPFVVRAFGQGPQPDETEKCDSRGIEPKVALLELGILLLEIWHCRTLENQFGFQETRFQQCTMTGWQGHLSG